MSHTKGPMDESSIDRGWAWIVLIACTAFNFLMGGTMKSYGVLYVEFITLFQCSPTTTGIIGFTFGICAMLFSPISGRLSDYYSVRLMSILGGIGACIGLAVTGHAPNIWVAVVSFGIIFGVTSGMIDGPILATLGKYFEKHRNFANGISFAGSSLGSLVLVPMTSYLIEEYTIRGAMLLLGGIWLNVCVIGAVLRPIYSTANYCKELEDVNCPLPEKTPSHINYDPEENKVKSNDICVQLKEPKLHRQMEQVLSEGPIKPKSDVKFDNTRHVKKNSKAKNILGSKHSVIRFISRKEKTSDTENLSQFSSLSNFRGDDDSKKAYLEFLCNPLLIRDLTILGCAYYAYYTPIMSLPAFGQELGINKLQVAWTVGLIGMIEIPSRLCLSWISDHFKIRPAIILTITFTVTAVCGITFASVPNQTTMIMYASVHGVLGGQSLVLMSSVLVQCVGVQQLGSAMGLALMQMNFAISLSSTSAGAMKQLSGTYGNVFMLTSSVYLFAAILYCVTPRGFFNDPYKSCR